MQNTVELLKNTNEQESLIEKYKSKALIQLKESKEKEICYSFTTFHNLHSELTYYILNYVLTDYQLSFLSDIVMTFLKEIINNAIKANLKRSFFSEQGLDFVESEKNEDEEGKAKHEKALKDFRNDVLSQQEAYSPLMNKLGLRVRLHFAVKPEGLFITVENNQGPSHKEAMRIRERVEKANNLSSLEEAFAQMLNDEECEGSGLGLIMNILLLKQTGIEAKNFKISFSHRCTKARLIVPNKIKKPDSVKEIYLRAIDEIQGLPTFPNSVQNILRMCKSKDVEISELAQELGKDASLSAGLLHTANSGAFYAFSKRIDNIPTAISVIGIKNLSQMVMYHASYSILKQRYKVYKKHQEHSEKCAFYSYRLARLTQNKDIAEVVYLGGLLHDMGKILLHSIEPELIKTISGINPDVTESAAVTVEEIVFGISHAEIGARLAEKWNFAENIVQMIRYHHSPFAAKEDFKREVSLIHLANVFTKENFSSADEIYIDVEAQNCLGISSTKELVSLYSEV